MSDASRGSLRSRNGQSRRNAHLRRLLQDAEHHVPFYRQHWQRTGVDLETLQLPQDWTRLPVVTKADLLAVREDLRLDTRFTHSTLLAERSSGSSGEPLTMLLDRSARRSRKLRFLRALLAVGYRLGESLMLIAARRAPRTLGLLRWRYADLGGGEEHLAAQFLRFRPMVLYGPLSTLLTLGEYLNRHHPGTHRPRLVVSTAEELGAWQGRALHMAYGGKIADFYGMTELGLLAWRAPEAEHYRLAEGDFFCEYLPCAEDPDLERLVVTVLAGSAMPLIRYETGDLVRREHALPGAPLTRFAGRKLDCIVLPGERLISPYRIEVALEKIPGLLRFEVIQQLDLSLDVGIAAAPEMRDRVLDAARRALHEVCSDTLTLRIGPLSQNLKPTGGKLRPVRSLAAGS